MASSKTPPYSGHIVPEVAAYHWYNESFIFRTDLISSTNVDLTRGRTGRRLCDHRFGLKKDHLNWDKPHKKGAQLVQTPFLFAHEPSEVTLTRGDRIPPTPFSTARTSLREAGVVARPSLVGAPTNCCDGNDPIDRCEDDNDPFFSHLFFSVFLEHTFARKV